ncbi:phosphatidyl serine synthase-domain-containing protein [Catenaria anguillulae PL171]|uniref:Phosphatidyl serine synthase-domain-containing protein n=1 Tax=Catenaria anguillulae PL171 TaxID=765915 RepID=A0A1Y2HPG6_9FUNG|nr:phosphatidyl serine synthase-domain-containing protein [Catenaria anguillulae PL171]
MAPRTHPTSAAVGGTSNSSSEHSSFAKHVDRSASSSPAQAAIAYPDPIQPSIEFLYKPHTLTALFALLSGFVYFAFQDYGDRASEIGVYASLGAFLLFGTVTFRDGPFIRPHPVFWRLVLAACFAYQLFLTYMLFQTPERARQMLTKLDPSLGIQLPERSYAESCELTPSNVWAQMDEFVLAHVIGWYGKSIILRDYWFCWILSVMFEVCEYSLQHQLPNFAECWWDHWIVDVLICNWLGIYLGMKTCEYLEMKGYSWRGFHELTTTRSKMRRAVAQFTPHSWTKFEWGSTKSFKNYLAVIGLLFFVLLAELNAFYLKFILWIPPSHPLNSARLLLVFLCGIPAVREAYQYLMDPTCKRFGTHAWLAVACVCTEVLICVKYDPHLMFGTPFPTHVVRFWAVLVAALVVYPIWQFVLVPWSESKEESAAAEAEGSRRKVE